jgi:hypothetical protein
MTSGELFILNGAIYCKDVIPNEMAKYLTHVLLRKNAIGGAVGDSQIPNAMTTVSHELFLETVHEKIWPSLEQVVGEPLLPTYTYARLYSNGDVLEKHKDRPACEISVTVQLGRSHNYAWPIFAGNHRFDLAEGDGMLYHGCDIEHWRDKCDGPTGYYSGQAFFHFVKASGKNADQANDPESRLVFGPTSYVKHRAFQMDSK